jgi:hypothetical protein
MVSSRDGASKGLNGFNPSTIGEGGKSPDAPTPQLAGLVDELAQALGVARESFNDRRAPDSAPTATVQQPAPSPQPPPSSLPVAIGRHLFDDEEDDAHMPIPSTWRAPPEPPKKTASMHDQLRAAGLGFATGLALVVPVVLLLTGKFGDLPFSNTLHSTQATKRAAAPVTPTPSSSFGSTATASVPSSVPAPTSSTPSYTTASTASPSPAVAKSSQAVPGTFVQSPPATRNVVTTAVTPAQIEPEAPPPPDYSEAVAEAKQRIADGDIVGARDVLSKAAAANNVEALLILGETYDPNMLAAWGARGASSDVAIARSLYGRALAAGSDQARGRLKALE